MSLHRGTTSRAKRSDPPPDDLLETVALLQAELRAMRRQLSNEQEAETTEHGAPSSSWADVAERIREEVHELASAYERAQARPRPRRHSHNPTRAPRDHAWVKKALMVLVLSELL